MRDEQRVVPFVPQFQDVTDAMGELPVAPYARIQEWFARVSALPAWRDTAPTPVPVAA